MINVTVKKLSDNSTQYHVTNGDINGRLIKSVHTVDLFGFDYAGGYAAWRVRAEMYAAEDTRLELYNELRDAFDALYDSLRARGLTPYDICFSDYEGRAAFKALSARLNIVTSSLDK